MQPTREEILEAAADMVKNLTTGENRIEYRAAIYQAAKHYEVTASDVGKELARRRQAKAKGRPKHKKRE